MAVCSFQVRYALVARRVLGKLDQGILEKRGRSRGLVTGDRDKSPRHGAEGEGAPSCPATSPQLLRPVATATLRSLAGGGGGVPLPVSCI